MATVGIRACTDSPAWMRPVNSAISRFYRLTMPERRERVGRVAGISRCELDQLQPSGGLGERHAERMIENAVGVFGLPQGIAVNLRLNGRDVLVPMVVEEPSVIAACSYAAKLLRAGGGVHATCSEPIMVGQIQLLEVDDPGAAAVALVEAADELLALANSGHPRLVTAGGGARSLRLRHLPNEGSEDPCGDMLIVHLAVDVRDAMGANAINTMCERIAPRIAELTGGRVALRILSNLSDQRTVTVTGRIPCSALEGKGASSGETLAKRIEEASVFAERDPYRACTHNKGIMNGVDAAAIALGQDWRAIEAGAHAFAARSGRYTALARWRAEDGYLVGRMTLPLAVGTVGGIGRAHPLVALNRRIAQVEHADQLAQICASAGLAQNLAALRALAAEGIQKGHMRLHARNIAVEAGADEHEVLEVAKRIADAGRVNAGEAVRTLEKMRGSERPPAAAPSPRRKRPPTPPTPRLVHTKITEAAMDQGLNDERKLEGVVLVTGASGHLGANLVRRLLDDGLQVRVLLREGSNNAAVDGLDVERCYGDLRDLDAMRAAAAGARFVFHCAAQLSTVETTPEIEREVFGSNVLGTKNILQACREEKVERVVVTGSFSATGYPDGDPATPASEELPFWPFEDLMPYTRTKALVEHEALKACVDGLDVVIATSCALIGPNDYKPSRMGRTLIDFANGKMPAYIPGGFPFVATSDIAAGHVLAMKRGRPGQKYIIATTYLEVDELMSMFEEVSGRPRPRVRLPGAVMAPVAEVSSFVLGTFFPNKPQRLTPHAVRILRKRRRADTSKAQRELGFRPTDIRHAIHEAYADFARRGLVPARPGTTEPAVVEKRSDRERPNQRAATGS